MKNKIEINEQLHVLFRGLIIDLEDACESAEKILHTAISHGRTGTRYLHLLRAIENVRRRANAIDCGLTDDEKGGAS